MNEITQQKINIYEFPNCADEEENKATRKLKVCLSTDLLVSCSLAYNTELK